MGRIVVYLVATLGFIFFAYFLLDANRTLAPMAVTPESRLAPKTPPTVPVVDDGRTGMDRRPVEPPRIVVALEFNPAFGPEPLAGEIPFPFRLFGAERDTIHVEAQFRAIGENGRTDRAGSWQALLLADESPSLKNLRAHPNGADHVVIWDSAEQAGRVDPVTVVVRLRARGIGTGQQTEWVSCPAFTVNNVPGHDVVPPSLDLVRAPDSPARGAISFAYRLVGDPRDRFALDVEFSTNATPDDDDADAGAETTWTTAMPDPTAPTQINLPANPIGEIHAFVWDSELQAGMHAEQSVTLRLRARGGFTGETTWFYLPAIVVDNRPEVPDQPTPPTPTPIEPRVTVSLQSGSADPTAPMRGDVFLHVELVGEADSQWRLAVEFSIDGENWAPATGAGASALAMDSALASPNGTTHEFVWHSAADDVATAMPTTVWLRAQAFDRDTGALIAEGMSPAFWLDNSTPDSTPPTPILPIAPRITAVTVPSAPASAAVQIGFTLFGPPTERFTGTFEFSTSRADATDTEWHPATSAAPFDEWAADETGIAHTFSWDTEADNIGRDGEQTVRIRVRMTGTTSDSGDVAVSDEFRVVNGAILQPPPPLEIRFEMREFPDAFAGAVRGDVTLRVALIGPAGDSFDIEFDFSTDGGETWRQATRAADSPAIRDWSASATGIDYTIIWDTLADEIGLTSEQMVSVRLKARSLFAGESTWTYVPEFPVTNAPAEPTSASVEFVEIVGTADGAVSGTVTVRVRLIGPSNDRFTLHAEVSADDGWTWAAVAPVDPAAIDDLSTSATGAVVDFTWDSREQIVGERTVQMRIVAIGLFTGQSEPATSPAFVVNNPVARPAVALHINSVPSETGPVRGDVEVRYTLTGPEDETFSVQVEFRGELDTTGNWTPATTAADSPALTDLRATPDGQPHTFRWAAGTQAGLDGVSAMQIRMRVIRETGEATEWELSPGFAVDNSPQEELPSFRVQFDRVPGPNETASGDIEIHFTLIAPPGDSYDMQMEFTADDGENWFAMRAAPGSSTTTLDGSVEGLPYRLVWASAEQVGTAGPQTVRIRLRASGIFASSTEWEYATFIVDND